MYFLREIKEYPFVDIQTSGIRKHIFIESIIDGFENITSIENIHNFAKYASILLDNEEYLCGYKFYRNRIKDLVTNFDELTDSQKYICCIHKIGTETQRREFLNDFNLYTQLCSEYAQKVSDCRNYRAKLAQMQVWVRLGEVNAFSIISESKDVFLAYVTFGLEGTICGDPEGITDYIYGTQGTSFEGIGLINKIFVPIFGTLQELCDLLYNILIEGKYIR